MKEYLNLLVWSIAANFGVKPGQYISDEDLDAIDNEMMALEDLVEDLWWDSDEYKGIVKDQQYKLNVALAVIIALATLSACLINIAWELL